MSSFFSEILHDPSADSTIGAYILTIAYGIKTRPLDDPFVTLSGEATRLINEVFLSPISFLLYLVPILQSFPEWCLGPSFGRQAKKAKELAREFRNAPFDKVERMMVGWFRLVPYSR